MIRSHRRAVTTSLAALVAVTAISCSSGAGSPPSTPQAPANFTVVSKKEGVPERGKYTVEYILFAQVRERVYERRACFEAAEIGKPLPVVAYSDGMSMTYLNADGTVDEEKTAKDKAEAKNSVTTSCR